MRKAISVTERRRIREFSTTLLDTWGVAAPPYPWRSSPLDSGRDDGERFLQLGLLSTVLIGLRATAANHRAEGVWAAILRQLLGSPATYFASRRRRDATGDALR